MSHFCIKDISSYFTSKPVQNPKNYSFNNICIYWSGLWTIFKRQIWLLGIFRIDIFGLQSVECLDVFEVCRTIIY